MANNITRNYCMGEQLDRENERSCLARIAKYGPDFNPETHYYKSLSKVQDRIIAKLRTEVEGLKAKLEAKEVGDAPK